jgi:hypothetical protein
MPAPEGNRYDVNALPKTLEHFHFYSEQDRAAKCGFSSTPASKLAGDWSFYIFSTIFVAGYSLICASPGL